MAYDLALAADYPFQTPSSLPSFAEAARNQADRVAASSAAQPVENTPSPAYGPAKLPCLEKRLKSLNQRRQPRNR
eukprot:5962962-Amphidinium_carterae.1